MSAQEVGTMPVQSEGRYLDDVLKFEEEDMRSREAVVIASGENLLCGQVIGKVTATGKVKKINFTGADGTENAAGIIGDDYDASLADVKGFAIAHEAVVAEQGLRWPVAFTSGGTYEVKPGDIIIGATSAKKAKVVRVDLASGTWAGGDAAGTFIVEALSGDFAAENVDVGANSNVATVAVTGAVAALAQLAAKFIMTRKEV
jgi:hypothetical protein